MTRRTIAKKAPWNELRSGFLWAIPPEFNIAIACCDSWAAAHPDRPAIVHIDEADEPRNWTYGELRQASDRFAHALAVRGVGKGDRIAILLPQSPEVMIAQFAAMKLGAIVLPLFTLFGTEALAYRLSDSGAKALVTGADNVAKIDALRSDLPDLRDVYVTSPVSAPNRAFWDEIERAADRPHAIVASGDDPAILIYTSGTTGAPKGALQAHRLLIGHMPSVELQHEFFPQPGDVGWTPADWAWIGGLMNLALPCLYHGVPLVSHRMRKFDPDAAFRLIADYRVRTLFLPPTALKLMRQASVPGRVDIRSIGSGGESLGADLRDWGRDVLRAPINEIYGQTECNLVIGTCHGAMDPVPGSMGRAVPGHDVEILDVDGAKVPRGAVGEICVRAPDPVMFLRYWNQPEKTAEKSRDGWLRTGDLGTCDAEGNFTYISRDDDIITSAGYRIGPTEIENCLCGDPDVTMAAAVGLPDPVRTEAVTAFVVLRVGADRTGAAERLVQRVRDKISPHVAPRRVLFVENLPMTATGKIMRRELRQRHG